MDSKHPCMQSANQSSRAADHMLVARRWGIIEAIMGILRLLETNI